MSGPGGGPPEGGGAGDHDARQRHEHLQALPGMRDQPVVWDHRAGAFVAPGDVWPSEANPYGASGRAAPGPPPPPRASGPSAPDGGADGWAPPPTAAVDPTEAHPAPGAGDGPGEGRSLRSGNPRHVVINAGEHAVRPGATRVSAGAPAPAPPAPGWSPGPAAPPGPPPGAPPYPGPRPAPARRPGPRRPFPLRRLVKPLLSLPLVMAVLLFAFAYVKFGQIPRAPVSAALSPGAGAGTNWLIVGTDSREGITAEDPNAGAFLTGGEPAGDRTDSIMVLRIENGTQSLLSIPRDLWVKDPKSGKMGRINGTFNAGPTNLIAAVRALGIPVHRYLEINFVGFGKLVDAVGGIDVEFPLPARDTHSGLDVPEAGVNRLDGAQALAYVRSRYYEELKGGKWVSDPLSDLSRVQRQRTFLTALMGKVSNTRNPFALGAVADAMTGGLRLDDDLNLLGAIGLALELRGFKPESVTLPTVNAIRGGAQVLDLDKPKATPVIGRFSA
jgi:LCP family protein required for cell wall assembly